MANGKGAYATIASEINLDNADFREKVHQRPYGSCLVQSGSRELWRAAVGEESR